uniref:Pyridoxal kinase n=1 Tax=Lepeophtheirus salmonis TaxID=72036 RepID=D3PGC6_LEPSM|nr:Pyridoxal kinase [Lepeophtheirus salmonis]
MDNKRILSIQSHVVSGYVGNKSSVFPLQLLGFEVDNINSVQLSNHTGYPNGIKGQTLDSTQLWELIQGLDDNNLLSSYGTIITGYVRDKSFLEKIVEVVKLLRKKCPNIEFVCDPVMGDIETGFYVPEELLDVYKSSVLPLADICLPNQFELQLITGITIQTEEDVVKALQMVHDIGVKTVILSSLEFKGTKSLTVYASSYKENRIFKVTTPMIPTTFVGSGDLFTALCTAWLKTEDLGKSLKKAIATMQSILQKTFLEAGPDNLSNPAKKELKLIQSKKVIENPDTSGIELTYLKKK